MQEQDLRNRCKEQVLARIDPNEALSDESVYRVIDTVLTRIGKEEYLSLTRKEQLRKELFDSLRGMDILQELLEDEEITEIMVNGPENIFYERKGEIVRWDKTFSSAERLEGLIHQIAARVNRIVSESRPIVDARLEGGSRVHAVLPPVALNGPILTIRKFGKHPMSLEEMTAGGSISKEAALFLTELTESGYNIFVSGGTGSGKTTFLNALALKIPEEERVITIEDAAELNMEKVPNLVRMEARMPNLEGELGVSIRDLLRAALRMRPDRIIVGEVRDEAALDMLQAMNTGHDGCFSTGHANSAEDMLSRLETMALMAEKMPIQAIRRQIGSALDILVHLERRMDGFRQVVSITEVCGYEEKQDKILLSPLFSRENGRELVRVGELRNTEKQERRKEVLLRKNQAAEVSSEGQSEGPGSRDDAGGADRLDVLS